MATKLIKMGPFHQRFYLLRPSFFFFFFQFSRILLDILLQQKGQRPGHKSNDQISESL